MENAQKLLVGFTGTAFRNDGKGLGEVFDVIAYERNIKYMLEKQGFLCPPKAFKVKTDLDLSKVETGDDDFQAASLEKVMNTKELNNITVEAYLKNAPGRQAIAFCVSVAHAMALADAFQVNNIKAAFVHGSMPKKERADIIVEYKAGNIQVLCNCQVFLEGFDSPETSCVIIAKPTKFRGLYQQMVGRGLRLYPNKTDCVVLDFGDVNHSICNTATLCSNFDVAQIINRKRLLAMEHAKSIPPKLHQKLKVFLATYDPLGKSFSWEKEGLSHVMQGNDGVRLEIKPQEDAKANRYCIIFSPLLNRILSEKFNV